nr:putative ribonuclease H-like domain-containing protein [Tanacetum cinerariifolium]
YFYFPVWSSGSINPQNTNRDATFDEKEPEFNEKKPESEVNVSLSNSAQSKKHDDNTKREAKAKSHVESFARFRNLSDLCKAFEKLMKDKFSMSSIGELTFFLGLQVKQEKDGIFISQEKYVAEILRKFGLTDGKSASTPIDTEKPLLKDPDASHLHAIKRIFRYLKNKTHLGLWYPKDPPFDLVAYSDSDYAGVSLDRKSTTGGCQFLGCRLIYWQCKKQTVMATSSTEAEYVAAASCCAQVLWILNQLLDYGYNFMHTIIYIDNSSTICIIKN